MYIYICQCICCRTQCPRPCSRPLLTSTSAGDSGTLKGKSGSVSCGVTAPFSWVLVHTRFCLCPPRVCFLCKFWWLCGGVNKRAYVIPRSAAPRAPALWQSTADLYLCRRHSDTVLAQSLWHLWVLMGTRFVWALWTSLAGKGFDSKCDFAPPTIFLGLLLCPWMWGISFGKIQHSPINGSAASCSFGVLTEDERILLLHHLTPVYRAGLLSPKYV